MGQNLVQHFVRSFQALLVQLALAIEIGFGFIGNFADTILNFLAEFVGLGTQLFVRELLHLGFERIDRCHTRQQALDFALISRAKNLA